MKLITVLMTSYNSGKWIRVALRSILSQTYKNLEIIIVDGGSSDKTLEIISAIKDARIKLIETKEISFVKKLNIGLKISKGKWVIRMDSDDISSPNRVEELVRTIKKMSNISFLAARNGFVFNDHLILPKSENWEITQSFPNNFTAGTIPNADANTIFNRKDAINVGGYDEAFEKETSLWYKLLDKGNGFIINKFLMFCRIHSNQLTMSQLPNDTDYVKLRKKYDQEGYKKIILEKIDGIDDNSSKVNRLKIISLFSLLCKEYKLALRYFIKIISIIGYNYNSLRRIVLYFINQETLKFWRWKTKIALSDKYKIYKPSGEDEIIFFKILND